MLRKLLVLALFMTSITACTPATPIPPVTETLQTRTATPVDRLFATEAAPTTTPTTPPIAVGDLKLTILYDNTATDSWLKSDWGFAALVEYGSHTLLFDTGADGSILLDNLRQLGVDPQSIEGIILSHEHNDHIGGLQALLDTGLRPTVYAPSTFRSSFKQQVRDQTRLVEVTDALEILPGVHTTRPVGSIVEQALVVETRDGTVVITGCAHPGVAQMVRQAQSVVDGKIALLVGGFHLVDTSKEKLPSIIVEVQQLGVERILPTHCTGDEAIALIRTEYGKNYIEGGVGRIVTSSPTIQTLLPVPADSLVIRNGTVIAGTGAAPISDGVVVIQGDRIMAVGPRANFAIPSNAQVIDARGGTILPGIINAHVHGTSSPGVRRVYFLLKGVTSVCDMGSPLVQMQQFAQDHSMGPAARGFKSGPIITVPGGYPDVVWQMDFNYEVASSEEAGAAVADLVDRGADVIKIALDPGGEGYTWPMLDLQYVDVIVQEAHAHSKLVRAHVGSTGDTDVLDIVLESGVDVIEHAPLPIFSASEAYELIQASGPYTMPLADKDQLALLAAQHVIMVPTLTAYEPLCDATTLTSQHRQECYDFIQGPVQQFHALGGEIALGNDYGADTRIEMGVPLREMQLLLAAGLTPMEVIEASTRNAAIVCGHGDELGTLEPGKLADVIIVDADPLVNIEAMNSVIVVIKGGQIAFPFPLK